MEENSIVEDSDQWLFAEDLNNFVFRQHDEFPQNPIDEECQEFGVYKGFNEIVRNAVDIIQKNSILRIEAVFSEMSLKADVMKEYQEYASHLWRRWIFSRFDGAKYLHYCAHISLLGERFYRAGFKEFDYLTFTAVREALECFDMLNGGWDSLNLAASKIIRMAEHFQNLPSPEQESGIGNFLFESFQALSEYSHDEQEDMSDSEVSSRNLESDYLENSSESDATYEDHSESVSSDESSSEHLISTSPAPIQSNFISSTITCEEFATPKEISFRANGHYYYKYSTGSNSQYLCHNFVNKMPHDISENSERNSRNESASISSTRSNEYGSNHFIPPHNLPQKRDVDENSETARKKFVTPKEISVQGNGYYYYRYTVSPKYPCLFHNFVNEVPPDLSEKSERNSRSESESVSLLHSNENCPQHSILPRTLPEKYHVDENSVTAPENVGIPREHTCGLERNRNDTNEIVQDLLKDRNNFYFQKLCSESRRNAKGHPFLTGSPESSSAACKAGTSQVSQISDYSEKCTPGNSNINLEVQKSGKIFPSPHNSAKKNVMQFWPNPGKSSRFRSRSL